MNFQPRANTIKQHVRSQRPCFGLYVTVPSPALIEVAALSGLDFVRIDWAHGAFDLSVMENMIRAAELHGITPMVRLDYDPGRIGQVLELGAMGVIVPDVTSAQRARDVVAAAKFAPVGSRGIFSATRGSGYGTIDASTYRQWSNDEVLVGIQIEDPASLDELDGILDVPGIDLVLSGRGDIANALDLPGQKNHPRVLEIEAHIFDKARARGLMVSPQLDPAAADFAAALAGAIEQGARVFSLGVDIAVIGRAFRDMTAKLADFRDGSDSL